MSWIETGSYILCFQHTNAVFIDCTFICMHSTSEGEADESREVQAPGDTQDRNFSYDEINRRVLIHVIHCQNDFLLF